jgi:hypothetical protein
MPLGREVRWKLIYDSQMQGLETANRTRNNVHSFHKRLKLLLPDIELEIIEQEDPEKHDPTGNHVENAREQVEHRHKWLKCMDEFADFIQNVEPPLPVHEPVTIALIDDGVDIYEQSLHKKIVGGRSFCQRDKFQNLSMPYYVTSGGHGTVMASLICRVCPKAELYVLKLGEYISENSSRQITAKSAAKVRSHLPFFSGVELDVSGLTNARPTGRPSSNRQTSPHYLYVLDDRAYHKQRG